MERALALKKLSKLLGKSMGYRVNPKAPDADERAKAKASLPALTEAYQAAEKAMQARRRALLDNDAKYQQLYAAWVQARKKRDDTRAITYRHKFTVGTSTGMFFMVKAEGDSWEEVIAKLKDGK